MNLESAPFIGDIFRLDKETMLWQKSKRICLVDKNLLVANFNMQNKNLIEIEMDLRSAIDKNLLNQEKDNNVLIGVDLEISTKENTTSSVLVRANMLKKRREAISVPVEMLLHRGKIKITQYHIISVELMKTVVNNVSLAKTLNFDNYLEKIKVFQDFKICSEKVENLVQNTDKLVIQQNEKIKLKNLHEALYTLGENFSIDCLNLLKDFSRGNWFVQIYSLIDMFEEYHKEIQKANKELSNFNLGSLELRDDRLKGKEEFIDILKEEGITYVGDAQQFHNLISGKCVFSLFFVRKW